MSYIISSTVDVDKFAGLNFCSFNPPPLNFLQKYFCVSLARKCLLLKNGAFIQGKLSQCSWKPWMFSPVNPAFLVYSITWLYYKDCSLLWIQLKKICYVKRIFDPCYPYNLKLFNPKDLQIFVISMERYSFNERFLASL